MQIDEKHVLVTGAARGLGKALVTRLAELKATTVWAAVRSLDSKGVLEFKVEIENHENKELKERIQFVQMDITKEDEINSVADQIPKLDILINNAALCIPGGVFQSEPSLMYEEFEVNYFSVIRVVRAFRKLLVSQQGLIVNVASQLVRAAMPALANYSASKSALVAISQTIRAELFSEGVKVCVVCPAGMETDMSSAFPGEKQDIVEAANEIIGAFDHVEGLVPIGPKAKALFEAYSADNVAAEKSKYGLTFEALWPNGLPD